jgi:hypothetical protein
MVSRSCTKINVDPAEGEVPEDEAYAVAVTACRCFSWSLARRKLLCVLTTDMPSL